jgi:hypothetical protein
MTRSRKSSRDASSMKPPSRARATGTVCSVTWRLMLRGRAGCSIRCSWIRAPPLDRQPPEPPQPAYALGDSTLPLELAIQRVRGWERIDSIEGLAESNHLLTLHLIQGLSGASAVQPQRARGRPLGQCGRSIPMLLCLSRGDALFRRSHFSGGGCLVLTGLFAGCGQDREGPLLAEGRLLLGHVQQVRKIRPGRPTDRSKASRFAAAEYWVRPSPGSVVSRRAAGGGRPRGRRSASGSG